MDYRKAYFKLFNSITTAIDVLQKAQQETEEMYISAEERILDMNKSRD